MKRPLVIHRRSLRKDGSERLPWVMRCGCGLTARMIDFEYGLRMTLTHHCDDFHP